MDSNTRAEISNVASFDRPTALAHLHKYFVSTLLRATIIHTKQQARAHFNQAAYYEEYYGIAGHCVYRWHWGDTLFFATMLAGAVFPAVRAFFSSFIRAGILGAGYGVYRVSKFNSDASLPADTSRWLGQRYNVAYEMAVALRTDILLQNLWKTPSVILDHYDRLRDQIATLDAESDMHPNKYGWTTVLDELSRENFYNKVVESESGFLRAKEED